MSSVKPRCLEVDTQSMFVSALIRRYAVFGRLRLFGIAGILLLLIWSPCVVPACAQELEDATANPETASLAEMSIEDLMEVQVTTPGRTPKKVSDTAAAVSVLTNEDLRRTGVTTIADALRYVPGLQVANVDAHQWAVSSRGFNDVFANKLLVMIDGRTVYTPLFSGVYWDVQDTFLEDVDRIEVIRGPGATMWGANAVNGVINIITRKASETQGMVVTGGAGTHDQAFGGVRYGGKISQDAYYRVYGKYFNRDNFAMPEGGEGRDRWEMGRGGFRIDWTPSIQNEYMLEGEFYGGNSKQTYVRVPPTPPHIPFLQPSDNDLLGGFILGRWSHQFEEEKSLTLQSYYDHTERESPIFRETRDTFDVDLQYRTPLGERQMVMWGVGYRATAGDTRDSFEVQLNPNERTTQLISTFLQDEITLVPDHWFLTLGSKLEHNDFTGIEAQPSARVLWTPNEKHSVWGSISRAVRTPSVAEDDIRLNTASAALGPGGVASFFGSHGFEAESLIAYELGYRVKPIRRLSFDLALFFNDYEELRSVEPVGFNMGPPAHVAFVVDNQLKGEAYGAELSTTWNVTDWWRWIAGYSWLELRIKNTSRSQDMMTASSVEGSSPTHTVFVRSSMDLPRNLFLDVGVRYVDDLPEFNIPSYLVADTRLAWRPTERWEAAIVGRNLLDDQHPEFGSTFVGTLASQVEHSVYGQLTVRF